MIDDIDGYSPESDRPRATRVPQWSLGCLLGLAATLVVAFIVSVSQREVAAPEITLADVEAAEARWQANQPEAYGMTIEIGGRQPGLVKIEVRDGQVVDLTRDGIRPEQKRTWEYWTVNSQFETIRQDFDSAARDGGFGAPPGTQTLLRAEFDPQYGYPRRYERVVFGTDLGVGWRVTSFAPLSNEPK